MSGKPQKLSDQQRWGGLEDWLQHSQAKRAALEAKKHALEQAAFDRDTDLAHLVGATMMTPAKTLGDLKLKAQIVLEVCSTPGRAHSVCLSGPGAAAAVELAEDLIRDLLAVEGV